VAQSRPGKKPLDRALPNDEAKLRDLYRRLRKHGPVLLVVDQPATTEGTTEQGHFLL
jgi:hypothetical protein